MSFAITSCRVNIVLACAGHVTLSSLGRLPPSLPLLGHVRDVTGSRFAPIRPERTFAPVFCCPCLVAEFACFFGGVVARGHHVTESRYAALRLTDVWLTYVYKPLFGNHFWDSWSGTPNSIGRIGLSGRLLGLEFRVWHLTFRQSYQGRALIPSVYKHGVLA